MKAGSHRRPHAYTGAFTPAARVYKEGDFHKCEMCGGDISTGFYGWLNDDVYHCNVCNFKKSPSHVSFGFCIKIPNYLSITKTHSIENLLFDDGTSIQNRIEKHSAIYFPSDKFADQVWEKWISENPIEMIRLTALSDHYTVGSSINVPFIKNPMLHFKEELTLNKGVFLSIVTIKTKKQQRSQSKIGHAIEYALKKSKSGLWITGGENSFGNETLENASARLNKLFLYCNINKDIPKHYIDSLNTDKYSLAQPIYISGPSLYKLKLSQEELDIYVDEVLTYINSMLIESNKIRVVINTGNTGVETSVMRWAVKNKVYGIIVNLPNCMYLNKDGYNRYDSKASTINRVLGRNPMNDMYSDKNFMELDNE